MSFYFLNKILKKKKKNLILTFDKAKQLKVKGNKVLSIN